MTVQLQDDGTEPSQIPDGAPPAAPARRTVTADTPCVECSYNLRGLTWVARCPECGAAAMLSLPGGGTHCRFDPALVRAEAGLTLAGVSRLVCCLAPLATPVASAFAAASAHGLTTLPNAVAERARRLRGRLVFIAVATAALWAAGFVSTLGERLAVAESFEILFFLGFVAESLGALAWLLLLRHLGAFAESTGRPRLARRLRRGAAGAAVLALLWAAVGAGAPFQKAPMLAFVLLMAAAPLPFIDAVQAVRRLRESINAQERFDALHAGSVQEPLHMAAESG